MVLLRVSAACFTLLLLLLLPLTPVGAEDEATPSALAGPHALDDAMQAAEAALLEGDVAKALPTFKEALATHKPKDYAKARAAEIADLIKQLACGVEHKRPKVKDLLSGKLQSWSPEKSKIRITYTPNTIKDLEKRGGLVHLPARMSGPFTVEIKGSSYPRVEGKEPVLEFGGDQHPETGKEQLWRITFGVPKRSGRTSKVTTTIDFLDGGAKTQLSSKTGTLSKPDKPYKLVLKVSKKKLSPYVGSRSSGTAKKPEDVWGYLAFHMPNWTELKLSGTIEASWINGRLREVFAEQLRAFEKNYDASAHVPAWLFEPLDREESKPDRKPVDLVAQLSPKHYDLYLEVDNAIRMEEWDEAAQGIPKLRAAGLSEATCEWLRAQLFENQNQLDSALLHLEKVAALEPDFLEAVLLRGSIYQQLGRYDEALATFEKATGVYAQFPSAYSQAANAMLLAGRPEDAAALTRAAARNGVYSPALLTFRDAINKVVNGPQWQKIYDHKSQNYHVISNIDRLLCREASKVLEEGFDAFRKKLGFVPRDKTRLFKVYLFKTREGFMAYMGRLEEFMGKPNDQAAGVYSPLLKQLLIWDLPQRSEMFNTIRHEGFHQYLDRVMPNPPVWFNEGMAVYHENGKNENGKITFGHMHPGYIRLLKSRGLIKLKKFLTSGPGLFYEDGHRSYAQGWLMVHMFQHTTPAYRQKFDLLVAGLKDGSAYGVVKKIFPDITLPQLEKDLRAYLDTL